MQGWETVLAAVGGLVLGTGLGVVLGRRGVSDAQRRVRQLRARLRASVIPVLEGQAHTLGLSREDRASDHDDPIEVALDLSQSIQRHQDEKNMAFSDTLELERAELEARRR